MKRKTYDMLLTKEDLNKVFNAIARYNKTFNNEIIIKKTEENEKENITWLTINYVNEPDVLLWLGVFLGREGM